MIFVWFVDLIWVEWKILLCLRVYEIDWVWHSWLSLLSSWLRLVGWGLSCLTIKCSLTMFEVGCGVIELSVIGKHLVDHMWSLLVAKMCLLLNELGQVRRVGWPSYLKLVCLCCLSSFAWLRCLLSLEDSLWCHWDE